MSDTLGLKTPICYFSSLETLLCENFLILVVTDSLANI